MKKRKKRKKKHHDRYFAKWTQEEENLLRKLYPNLFTHELEERFGRTVASLVAKASQLGIKKNWRKYDPALPYNNKLWTQREINRLKKLYPTTPIQQLMLRFPKRSKETIVRKANSLGLKKNYLKPRTQPTGNEPNLWREEKELLIKLYPTMTNEELAEKFGRTEAAIRGTAWRIGLHKTNYVPGKGVGKNGKPWSKKEDALIRKLYPTMWTKDLAAQLNRTESSVKSRASTLGVQKDPEKFTPPPRPDTWSDKDIKKLRQLWEKGLKTPEIAKNIGKTQRSVAHQIERQKRDFGLEERYGPSKRWSRKEDKYLIRNYSKKSYEQIGAKLGRTKYAVRCRAVALKITTPDLNRWTTEEVNKLWELWQEGYTITQIAEITSKTEASVSNQIRRQKRDFGLPEKPNRWPKEQTAYLIKHYHRKSAKELADILGRTPQSIFAKARKLKLSTSAPKSWTEGQLKTLVKYYSQWTAAKIAEKIGKTTSSVQTKALRLGLRKKRFRT